MIKKTIITQEKGYPADWMFEEIINFLCETCCDSLEEFKDKFEITIEVKKYQKPTKHNYGFPKLKNRKT